MKKTCTRCKRRKDESEFCFRNKKKGIRQSRCRECTRADMRQQYSEKKEYYVVKAVEYNRNLRSTNRRKLLEYFAEHPCVDCGEDHPACLQFDHVKGNKKEHVSVMAHTQAWKYVLKEIKKCVVRCANCHAKRTAKQFGFYSA